FLGVFSEKTSMRVVIESAYAQLPPAEVGAFMNDDPHRNVDEKTDLPTIVHLFLSTPYRRLVVLRGKRPVGQISRRDALRAGFPLLGKLAALEAKLDATHEGDGLESLADRPTTAPLSAFMDRNARTVAEDDDLLSLANVFLRTNYRRLPVLRDRRLMGQISRRDLLKAAHQMMAVPSTRESNLLYLSSLRPREEAPIA
ncbi:MAG: HPP family protein, partial [Maioricimonas sp. JB049]